MSQTICKNCGASLVGAYCHKCGQKANISRITIKSLGHEITHSLTHIERGFFYTSIELFIHPGRVINGYLSGKRENYHKPFGLYFIWVTIFLLVDNALKEKVGYATVIDLSPEAVLYKASMKVLPYYEHYLALIILPLIVISPLITYHLIIKKLNYNYAEAIIVGIYIQVTGFIIAIFIETLGVITGTFAIIQNNQIIFVTSAVFQIWMLYDIIKRAPYWKSFLIAVLVNVIGYTIFICYLRLLVPFVVGLFM